MKTFAIFTTILFIFRLINGFKLTCNYQEHFSMIGLDYMCMVQEIDFSENLPYLNEAFGNHMKNKSNQDVTYIFIYGQPQLKSIPKGMLKVFPNLLSIHVENSAITELIGDELNQYRNLKSFELLSTQVERIPANFFSFTPKIEYIFFINNKIKWIGRDLLRNKPKLISAAFDEICIKKKLMTPIAEVIDALKNQCAENIQRTTKNIATTTTRIPTTTSIIDTITIPPNCQPGTDEKLCKLRQKLKDFAQILKDAQKKWF